MLRVEVNEWLGWVIVVGGGEEVLVMVEEEFEERERERERWRIIANGWYKLIFLW